MFISPQALGHQLSQMATIIDAFLGADPSRKRRDLLDTTLKSRLLVQRILTALDATRDFDALFAPENLKLLARWANERG